MKIDQRYSYQLVFAPHSIQQQCLENVNFSSLTAHAVFVNERLHSGKKLKGSGEYPFTGLQHYVLLELKREIPLEIS